MKLIGNDLSGPVRWELRNRPEESNRTPCRGPIAPASRRCREPGWRCRRTPAAPGGTQALRSAIAFAEIDAGAASRCAASHRSSSAIVAWSVSIGASVPMAAACRRSGADACCRDPAIATLESSSLASSAGEGTELVATEIAVEQFRVVLAAVVGGAPALAEGDAAERSIADPKEAVARLAGSGRRAPRLAPDELDIGQQTGDPGLRRRDLDDVSGARSQCDHGGARFRPVKARDVGFVAAAIVTMRGVLRQLRQEVRMLEPDQRLRSPGSASPSPRVQSGTLPAMSPRRAGDIDIF